MEQMVAPLICTFIYMHLKDTLMDFGPPHASWCFAFERYNGVLGSFHTNKKEIEAQIMCKFSQNQGIHTLDITSNEIFHTLLPISYQKPLNHIVHNIDSLSFLHYAQS